MLILLKKRLEIEENIFVVGFSFRDSIIASIFDEVIRKKSEEALEQRMHILLLDHEPEKVIVNLKRQGYMNIANIITPVKVSFPDTLTLKSKDENYVFEMEKLTKTIIEQKQFTNIDQDMAGIKKRLSKYDIHV